jgi:hypothetical protein
MSPDEEGENAVKTHGMNFRGSEAKEGNTDLKEEIVSKGTSALCSCFAPLLRILGKNGASPTPAENCGTFSGLG